MATRPVEKDNIDNGAVAPALSDLTAMSDLTPDAADGLLELRPDGIAVITETRVHADLLAVVVVTPH